MTQVVLRAERFMVYEAMEECEEILVRADFCFSMEWEGALGG